MSGWEVTGSHPETIDAELALRLARDHYMPGEKVRLTKGLRFVGEDEASVAARAEMFGDKILTVAGLVIEATGEGNYRPQYRFVEVEGTWPARAFQDERPLRHLFGEVLEEQGSLWFTPMRYEGDDCVIAEDPIRLVEDLSAIGQRFFESAYEAPDASTVAEMLRTSFGSGDGCSGEFTLRQNDAGDWHIDGVAWTSDAVNADAIREKIREQLDSPSPATPG